MSSMGHEFSWREADQIFRKLNADPYKVLSVSENSSLAEIKSQYYRLCRELHPDTVNSTEDAPRSLGLGLIALLGDNQLCGVESRRRVATDDALAHRRRLVQHALEGDRVVRKYMTQSSCTSRDDPTTTMPGALLSREEQKDLILKQGGRVLKFKTRDSEFYYRYYFPQPNKLKWRELVDGLRVLYGVASEDVYIVYKDEAGSKINVTDDGGLKIMFEENSDNDVIRVEVITDGSSAHGPPSNPSGLQQQPPSIAGAPTVIMPMPPVGFPGMSPSRADSRLSNITHQPPPPMMNAGGSQAPGPVPMAMPQHVAGGPVHNSNQAYGHVANESNATLPPPRPQKPLDEL
ncbi:hypothetical protein GGI12_004149 [Dipsacomyces acuminosporus]|nr:hypothetical protein GGI12_004149 [Dipsacomyces acuminosporus]